MSAAGSLTECIARLASADEAERSYAAVDLGYLNAPAGALALLDRLQQEASPVVRDAILQALSRIEADEAIAGTIPLFESEDPQLRNLAVSVLRLKGGRSIPFLKKAMLEGDHDTRKLALDALSGIPAIGAEEIYAAALADEDPNVTITAVENLGKVRALEFRQQIEDLLKNDAHPMLTAACLEALAEIGDENSLAVIAQRFPKLAELPDFFLTPCLKAIAALGSARQFPEVAALLKKRAQPVRPAVLNALLAIQQRCLAEQSAPPAMDDLLADLRSLIESDNPPPCRYQAVRLLGFWAERDEISAFLVGCLTNPERMVRLGAAEALQSSTRPKLDSLLGGLELKKHEGDPR